MKRNWNFSFSKVIVSVAALLAATSAFAIPKEPCAPKHDVCCEDPAAGPFAFSYPKDIGLSCPRDFYVHGDFLWMKPSMEGLEYGITDTDGTVLWPLVNGKVHGFSTGSQEWDWRPGFRVGFGFYSNHDAWQFDANWTYLRIKADASNHIEGQGIILPMWLFPGINIINGELKRASARWSGDFNTFDLMLGKPYHISRYFIANPMFGLRGAWIDQDMLFRYSLINQTNAATNVIAKNNYWGAGLRAYCDGQFLLGSGWYIYGKAAFSLLFSKFDISQTADYLDVGAHDHLYKFEDDFYSVQPNAELGMGISWSRFFNKGQYQVSVKVGYEFHHWWDQNQLRRFFDATSPIANDTVSRGDLSFNGFQFALHFEF